MYAKFSFYILPIGAKCPGTPTAILDLEPLSIVLPETHNSPGFQTDLGSQGSRKTQNFSECRARKLVFLCFHDLHVCIQTLHIREQILYKT